MTQYFVRPDGSYIGAFDVAAADLPALLPAGAIQVPVAPVHAAQIWNAITQTWSVPPAPVVNVLYKTLRERLTDAEKQAILGSTDWRVRDFLGLAQAEGAANINSPLTQQAKTLLVSLGLLTQARADAVIAP